MLDVALDHHRNGRLVQAQAGYAQILQFDEKNFDALHLLGVLAQQIGKPQGAVEFIGRAIAINRKEPFAHFNLANALVELGRTQEAVASYDRAIALQPNYVDALINRGDALRQLLRFDDALTNFDKAIKLSPDDARAHSNRSIALAFLGRNQEALEAGEKAIALRPDFPQAYVNRGNARHVQRDYAGARADFDQALALQPQYPAAYFNRGNVALEQNQLDDALANYDAALAIWPTYPEALAVRAQVLAALGRPAEALESDDRAIAANPAFAAAYSHRILMLQAQESTTGAALLNAAKAYGATFGRLALPPFRAARKPGQRLRIGFVSGDLCGRPVGHFIAPLFTHYDRTALEVFCYDTARRDDTLTETLRGQVDHWRCIAVMSDEAAAQMIRHDKIDVLIDLAGHTGDARLPLFAHRAAAVQVSWLGYWGTTGLPQMDHVLTDAITVPSGEEALFTENVVHLPQTRSCYAAPADAPAPAAPPSVATGTITFGSFNTLAKIGPDVVSLWAAVLNAVPGSRLLLKSNTLDAAEAREWILAAFAQAGIAADRLDLRAASPHAEMLAAYADVDIALDPFPLGGGLTSCEALWMGVPVVTLAGRLAGGRQTEGFLRTIGLPGLVAADRDAYVGIAVDLARNPERLAALHADLRPRMAASPLCDGPNFARAFETAMRGLCTPK